MSSQSELQSEPQPLARFQKTSDIPEEYRPPKPTGSKGDDPWSEDPQTIAYILRYANNKWQAEIDAKLESKRQEEERLKMQAYEKQHRERRKQMQFLNNSKAAVGLRLRKFASSEQYHASLLAHTTADMRPLITDFRRLLNKMGIDEA